MAEVPETLTRSYLASILSFPRYSRRATFMSTGTEKEVGIQVKGSVEKLVFDVYANHSQVVSPKATQETREIL